MSKTLGLLLLAVVACCHAAPSVTHKTQFTGIPECLSSKVKQCYERFSDRKVDLITLRALTITANKEVNEQIVGGVESNYCEFPHMAYLSISFSDGDSFCGATLISDRHLLTATHCIVGIVKSISAHFGSTNKNNATNVVPVKKWVKHSGYKESHTIDNDIAVLELERPVVRSKCVQPIYLPRKGDTYYPRCVTAGWGQIGENQMMPTQMRRTGIDIIPNDKCQTYSPGATVKQHICAGDLKRNGENICNGDSGGGLICKRKSDNRYVIAGITSYGFDCDEGFGVFANTANFLDFIAKNTK